MECDHVVGYLIREYGSVEMVTITEQIAGEECDVHYVYCPECGTYLLEDK